MLRVFLAALGFLCATSYAEVNMVGLDYLIKNNPWAVAEGTHNNFPLMIRFRSNLTSELDISNHPQLIQVYWSYGKHESGMPSSGESQHMEVFENRLVYALENDLTGILVAVITTGGVREWVYYTKSLDAFAERLHNMPQESAPYPIEIETDNDPAWEYFFNQVRPE